MCVHIHICIYMLRYIYIGDCRWRRRQAVRRISSKPSVRRIIRSVDEIFLVPVRPAIPGSLPPHRFSALRLDSRHSRETLPALRHSRSLGNEFPPRHRALRRFHGDVDFSFFFFSIIFVLFFCLLLLLQFFLFIYVSFFGRHESPAPPASNGKKKKTPRARSSLRCPSGGRVLSFTNPINRTGLGPSRSPAAETYI